MMRVSFCRSLLLLTLLFLGGCGTNTPPKSPSNAMLSSDLTQLGRLIRLPVAPRAATFESLPLGGGGSIGPSDWMLVAVLDYEPEALQQFLAQPESAPPEAAIFSAQEMRPWFPPEVHTTFQKDASGANRCRGKIFDASPFFKGPLLEGNYVVPEGTHFIVLRLHTS